MQPNCQSHFVQGNTRWILCWNQPNYVATWQETEMASRMRGRPWAAAFHQSWMSFSVTNSRIVFQITKISIFSTQQKWNTKWDSDRWSYRPVNCICTVGTPYNTAPYITGSNIARLGHGSQNSWSKLWIPIVKSAPVRVIFTWKSVLKKRLHGSSDIYLGTQWKQRHGSPRSYRSDVIVTFLWYGTICIIWRRDHQSTAKKV